MIDEIFINAGPRRHRIALLEAGRLVEFYITQRGERHTERIILGRVTKVQGDLDAAFVDIGEAREGLLSARDAAVKRGTPIAKAVQEGQALIVQVKREAEGEKGAKLSARPRLAEKGLALLPLGTGVELSKHIADPDRREKLQSLAGSLRARMDCGLILRAAAGEMDDADLEREADILHDRWRKISADAKSAQPAALLHAGDDPLAVVLREHGGPALRRICVDDGNVAGQLRRSWQSPDVAIEVHGEAQPLYLEHGLEEQIEAAMTAHVNLPAGGRIIIEHTQALTAIDVDSGQADGRGDPARLARETNARAAREIARQLRLREIGGRTVIDFIPMRGKGEVADLLTRLQGWLDHDPAQIRLGRMSELGLVELTRRRRQPALAQRLSVVCPLCNGAGQIPRVRWVADNLLDRILRESHAAKGRPLAVRAAAAVAADLGGPDSDLLAGLARERGCRVHLVADAALALEEFEVTVAS